MIYPTDYRRTRLATTFALAGLLAAAGAQALAAGSHEGGHGEQGGHMQEQDAGHGHGNAHGHDDGHGAGHGDGHGGGHDDGHGGGHAEGHGPTIGKPGEAAKVDRTIEVTMTDNRFDPETIRVEEGQTVRFEVRNEGKLVHEFNIATAAMHASHQEEMMQMMTSGVLTPTDIHHDMMGHGSGMSHDHANSVLLEPGKSGEVIWRFTADTDLQFACNVPGHYESGMVGEVNVQD